MSTKPDLGALFGVSTPNLTFLGLETCTDLDQLDAPIALIGAPCATPYRSVGAYCRNASSALRSATRSLTPNLDRHDFDSGGPLFPEPRLRPVDCGDLPFDEADGAGNRETIHSTVSHVLKRGAVPIVMGGDDSVPIPMIFALGGTGRKYTILQIDAHIDWREEHMDERMGLSSTMRRASEMPHIERIIQVGARGIGSASTQDYLDALAWGVSFVTAYDLHRHGVNSVLELIPRDSEIIVCVDADGLDPAVVPGVIARCAGGLSYYQTVDLIRGAAARGRIAAMDFVEFMPEQDVDGIGGSNLARLIMTAMGVIARQKA